VDAQVVLILTYVVAGALVAGYIWFMIWRVRVDRRKKGVDESPKESNKPLSPLRQMLADQAAADEAAGIAPAAAAIPVPPAGAPVVPPVPTQPTMSAQPPAPAQPATPQPMGTQPPATATIIDALTGIKLPNDLSPLTTLAERFGAIDRIAFWTNTTGADTVTSDFTGELERLGYKMADFDSSTKAAHRDGVMLLMAIYAEAHAATNDLGTRLFPSVPEGAVVVDVWIPGA
jgi:hypothetical protein